MVYRLIGRAGNGMILLTPCLRKTNLSWRQWSLNLSFPSLTRPCTSFFINNLCSFPLGGPPELSQKKKKKKRPDSTTPYQGVYGLYLK